MYSLLDAKARAIYNLDSINIVSILVYYLILHKNHRITFKI